MGQVQPQPVPDSARLTQYGEKPPQGEGFHDKLRTEIGETEMSLIWGDLDTGAAAILVTRTIAPWADSRTTTAVRLRNGDFRVVHSPTRGNPLHVSVFPPDLSEDEPTEWDQAMAERFNGCFTEEDAEGGDLGG
jgi:hypothetical protein